MPNGKGYLWRVDWVTKDMQLVDIFTFIYVSGNHHQYSTCSLVLFIINHPFERTGYSCAYIVLRTIDSNAHARIPSLVNFSDVKLTS